MVDITDHCRDIDNKHNMKRSQNKGEKKIMLAVMWLAKVGDPNDTSLIVLSQKILICSRILM